MYGVLNICRHIYTTIFTVILRIVLASLYIAVAAASHYLNYMYIELINVIVCSIV